MSKVKKNKDLNKKIKKLDRRRKVALTLIIIVTIILVTILGLTTYNIINGANTTNNNEDKNTTNNNKNENIVNNNTTKCKSITPIIDDHKYTLKLQSAMSDCVDVKINKNFNFNYKINKNRYQLYVHDKFIYEDYVTDNIVLYVTDNVVVIEKSTATCELPYYLYVTKDGNYNDISYREGMCTKSEPIVQNNELIFEATSNCGCDMVHDSSGVVSNPNWYINTGSYFKVLPKSSTTEEPLSLEKLAQKYGITSDYGLVVRYRYNLDDIINMPLTIEGIKSLKDLYSEISTEMGFYSSN